MLSVVSSKTGQLLQNAMFVAEEQKNKKKKSEVVHLTYFDIILSLIDNSSVKH